eukprot:167565-Chlamydomonas_euryale.AAC.2
MPGGRPEGCNARCCPRQLDQLCAKGKGARLPAARPSGRGGQRPTLWTAGPQPVAAPLPVCLPALRLGRRRALQPRQPGRKHGRARLLRRESAAGWHVAVEHSAPAAPMP